MVCKDGWENLKDGQQLQGCCGWEAILNKDDMILSVTGRTGLEALSLKLPKLLLLKMIKTVIMMMMIKKLLMFTGI